MPLLGEASAAGAGEYIEVSEHESRILLVILALDAILVGWLARRSRLHL